MQNIMSFLGTMTEESKTGFNNIEQSHNKQITALKAHLEDSLTLCRDEYREHAKQAAQRCTDLEVEFKKLQTFVSAEQSELKRQVAAKVQAPAPFDIGRQNQSASSKFVARKLFARGWCTFGSEATEGMKTADLIEAGTSLINMLTSEMQSWLQPVEQRFHAPHFRNWQLQINLNEVGPDDAGWQICKVINDRLRSEGTTMNNKSFYLTPDMELWKRQRNGCINRANDVVLRELPPLGSSELCRLASQKSTRWGVSLYTMKLDVHRAFDALRHGVIEAALDRACCPVRLQLAMLRELAHCDISLDFQGSVW